MSTERDGKEGKAMPTANDVRRAHYLLDHLGSRTPLSNEHKELLRSFLPELPKQQTLEEITEHVCAAWTVASGIDWGGNSYDADMSIDDWLWELYAQLKGLEDAAATVPAHPEFLETEADYENAPEGTIAARSGQIPWVKESDEQWSCISGAVVNYSMAQNKPRRILRWGWGNE